MCFYAAEGFERYAESLAGLPVFSFAHMFVF